MSLKPHPNPAPNVKLKNKKPVRGKKAAIAEEEVMELNVDEQAEAKMLIGYEPPVVTAAYIEAAFPPPPTWDDITRSTEPQWISFSMLVHWLMAAKSEHCLTGWAGVHDPLFRHPDKLPVKQHPWSDDEYEEMGALELDGVVLIFYRDPSDGYRSYSGEVLVWPGQELQTRLPNVPVRFSPASSQDWDDPYQNDPKQPSLLDMKSPYASEPLLIFGTSYPDSYYPNARFYMDPTVMNEVVAPLSENQLLHDEVQQVAAPASKAKKKKM